jgi:hypothetical protein
LHIFREKRNQKNSTHYPRAASAGHKGTATRKFVRVADTTPSLTKLLAAKEAAGSRPAWWFEFGRITRWEGAALRMSAGFSQISDAIKAGRLRESLSFLGGTRKIARLTSDTPQRSYNDEFNRKGNVRDGVICAHYCALPGE